MSQSVETWSADGDALRQWRLSQKPRWWDAVTLANEAGVSIWSVRCIELGKPVQLEARMRLAAYTGLRDALLSPAEREAAAAAIEAGRGA